MQLVEGSSSGPFLLTSASALSDQQPAEALFINGLEASAVADAVLLVLSAHVGDNDLQLDLLASQILTPENGKRVFSETWSLASPIREACIASVRESARLGVVILEENSVFSDEVVGLMRDWKIQIEVYDKRDMPIS